MLQDLRDAGSGSALLFRFKIKIQGISAAPIYITRVGSAGHLVGLCIFQLCACWQLACSQATAQATWFL